MNELTYGDISRIIKSGKRRVTMENAALFIDKKTRDMIGDYVLQGELLDDLKNFFSLFSDNTRLRIISALAISDMCVTDISAVLGINQTTVSHQLKFMRSINAVNCKRDGKVIYYSLKNGIINDVLLKGVQFLGT